MAPPSLNGLALARLQQGVSVGAEPGDDPLGIAQKAREESAVNDYDAAQTTYDQTLPLTYENAMAALQHQTDQSVNRVFDIGSQFGNAGGHLMVSKLPRSTGGSAPPVLPDDGSDDDTSPALTALAAIVNKKPKVVPAPVEGTANAS